MPTILIAEMREVGERIKVFDEELRSVEETLEHVVNEHSEYST